VYTVANISRTEVVEAIGAVGDRGEYADVAFTKLNVEVKHRGLCQTSTEEPRYVIESADVKRLTTHRVVTFRPIGFEAFSEAWRRLGLCP
jgi:hypothetical protein